MNNSLPVAVRQAVEEAQRREDAELARAAEVQASRVIAKWATGSGDIDETFALNLSFRLVYVRCHFQGGQGKGEFHIGVDSAQGSVYDARLYTVKVAGAGADVHLRLTAQETARPSSWSLRTQDAVRVTWTNPDSGNMVWGLEVGLAPA